MFVSEKKVEVRYADTDQMGVVYHANYVVWMEIGRTQLIRDLGYDYAKLEEMGSSLLSSICPFNIKKRCVMDKPQQSELGWNTMINCALHMDMKFCTKTVRLRQPGRRSIFW